MFDPYTQKIVALTVAPSDHLLISTWWPQETWRATYTSTTLQTTKQIQGKCWGGCNNAWMDVEELRGKNQEFDGKYW